MTNCKCNYLDKSLFSMHNLKSPCINCENRFLGCHSSCSGYQSFRQKLDVVNAARRKIIGSV